MRFHRCCPEGAACCLRLEAVSQVENAQVAVLDARTGRHKILIGGASQAEYVDLSPGTGQPGFLIYAAAGTLRAVRFDLVGLEVLGDAGDGRRDT